MRVRESERDPTARIDWAGLVTFSAGLFCLVFALIRGNDDGWGSAKIVALLVAGGAAPRRVRRWSSCAATSPCSTSACSACPTFTGAQIVAFSIHASMFSMFLYITLYMQNVLGYTPLEAGRSLPAGVAPVLPRRADRGQARRALPGAAVPDRRPVADRPRAAARCTASSRATTGPLCSPASSSRASASASSTRRSPPPRSGSWSRAAAARPRASTARPGRWAPRSGSPASARSSSRS